MVILDILVPIRQQAITWTNADFLLIRPVGTNICEILMEMQLF